MKANWTRRIIILCAVLTFLLVSPLFIIALVSIPGKIDEWVYRPTAHFSDVRWKQPDLKYRFSVLQEVLDHQVRAGMTPAEVKARLGTPDSVNEGAWQYEARRPGWHYIDWQGGGLLVTFSDQNLVEKAERNHWVD